jgi:hypothetical protein
MAVLFGPFKSHSRFLKSSPTLPSHAFGRMGLGSDCRKLAKSIVSFSTTKPISFGVSAIPVSSGIRSVFRPIEKQEEKL